MQYIPCNSALLAQETLQIATNFNLRQNSVCSGLKFLSESKLFVGPPHAPAQLLPPWSDAVFST